MNTNFHSIGALGAQRKREGDHLDAREAYRAMAVRIKSEMYGTRKPAGLRRYRNAMAQYDLSAQTAFAVSMNPPKVLLNSQLASQESCRNITIKDPPLIEADLANRRTTSYLSPYAPVFVPTSFAQTTYPCQNNAQDKKDYPVVRLPPDVQQRGQASCQRDEAAPQTESIVRNDSFEYMRLSHCVGQRKVRTTAVSLEDAAKLRDMSTLATSYAISPEHGSEQYTTDLYNAIPGPGAATGMISQSVDYVELSTRGGYGGQSFGPPYPYNLPSTLPYFPFLNGGYPETVSNGNMQQPQQPSYESIIQPEPRAPRLSLQMAKVLQDHQALIELEDNFRNRELELERLTSEFVEDKKTTRARVAKSRYFRAGKPLGDWQRRAGRPSGPAANMREPKVSIERSRSVEGVNRSCHWSEDRVDRNVAQDSGAGILFTISQQK